MAKNTWTKPSRNDEYATPSDTHTMATLHFLYFFGGGRLRRYPTKGGYQEVGCNSLPADNKKAALVFAMAKYNDRMMVDQAA